MKIAIFSDVFLPTVSGVSTSVQDISRLLAERGHHVLVVAPHPDQNCDPTQFDLHPNIEVFWAPAIDLMVYPELRVGFPSLKMMQKLKSFHPDIIHTQAPFTVGFQGIVLGRRQRVPLITTHHTNFTDIESLKVFNLYGSALATQIQKGAGKIITFFLNKHDSIIVPTDDTYQDVKQMGVRKPARVIPSPIDINALHESRAKGKMLRKKYGIKQSCLFVGRLSGEKNIDLVIKAFAKAKQQLPKLQLVLVGDGPDRKRLKSIATKLKINQDIIWTGKIAHDKLINDGYFYLGDVFITLSRFETQGISTIEAMACGLPVIGAQARATQELVRNVGIVVATDDLDLVADKLVTLMGSPKLQKKLVKYSLAKAAEFDPAVIVEQILAEYQRTIKAKKAKSRSRKRNS